MSNNRNRFRPQLDALEAREVPAAFSFQLPDGSVGSGLLSTPKGVNPNVRTQALALTDLSVTRGGTTYTVQSGAVANYANGVLVGVIATATSSDTISLNNGAVTVGIVTAPVVYDAADTEMTFTLPDGTVGAISYTIPWDNVDSTLASQTVSPTAFNLNIAGQNIASGFTTAPALTFAYGELTGLNFAADTSALVGFGFTSVAMAGLNITAVQVGTGQQFIAAANVLQTILILDFSQYTSPQQHNLLIQGTLKDGTVLTTTVTIPANTQAGVVRDLVFSVMEDAGFDVKISEGNRLIVKSKTKSPLKELEFTANGGGGWKGPTLRAASSTADVTPVFKINNAKVAVTP